jgi:hypothetical protein
VCLQIHLTLSSGEYLVIFSVPDPLFSEWTLTIFQSCSCSHGPSQFRLQRQQISFKVSHQRFKDSKFCYLLEPLVPPLPDEPEPRSPEQFLSWVNQTTLYICTTAQKLKAGANLDLSETLNFPNVVLVSAKQGKYGVYRRFLRSKRQSSIVLRPFC